MKISIDDLVTDLKRLSVETGSLACMGCGHEHDCGIHGCALIRKAVGVIEVFGGAFTEDACVKLAASYLDVMPEQLRAWAAAHKDERLVELPCVPRLRPYPDNAVYYIVDDDFAEDFVCQVSIGENSEGRVVSFFDTLNGDCLCSDDVGKTVFFSLDEVSSALIERRK